MKQLIGALVLAAGLLSPLYAGDGDKKPVANFGGLDESGGGTVTGVVKFSGARPDGKALLEEKWIFGKNGDDDTFGNVLVYVSKGLEGKKFAPPKEPAVLDQSGCVYTPHVVG